MYDLFSKENEKYRLGSYRRYFSLQPKAVEACALPGSHEFLLSRSLNVESLGNKNETFLTHGLSGKLPPVVADLPQFNILRVFQHMLGTKG